MDFFFLNLFSPATKTQVTHYSSASLYFLIYTAQDYVLDRESWSSCYHSITAFSEHACFCTAIATYRLKLKTIYYSQVRTTLGVGERGEL